jgi:hypothetical protein
VFAETVMPSSALPDNIHATNESTALEHYSLKQVWCIVLTIPTILELAGVLLIDCTINRLYYE